MFGSECVVHHARIATTGPAAPPPTPYPQRLRSSPPGRCLSLLKGNKDYSTLLFFFFFFCIALLQLLLDLFPLSFYNAALYPPTCPAV